MHKGQKVKNLCGLHIDFGEFTKIPLWYEEIANTCRLWNRKKRNIITASLRKLQRREGGQKTSNIV